MDNWDEAKKVVEDMIFPPDPVMGEDEDKELLGWEKIKGGRNQHHFGKKEHQLTEFEMNLPKVNRYELKAQMNRCDECNKARNKYFMLSDIENSNVFVHYIYRSKWSEKARVSDMFS